jgi:F-type H+-transporting ATPase subunit alpha
LPAVDQVMSIYAGTEGYLDEIPVKDVQRWEAEFHRFMREQRSELRAQIDREKKLTDETIPKLKAALHDFNASYRRQHLATDGKATAAA